jgi:serine/threonine protein phosphatase PrpC
MPGADQAKQSSSSRRPVLKWEIGAASECGVRDSNEDSYVAINNLDELIRSQDLVSFADQDFGETHQQGLYAIFDGHVGNQAARFAAEKFVSGCLVSFEQLLLPAWIIYVRRSFRKAQHSNRRTKCIG